MYKTLEKEVSSLSSLALNRQVPCSWKFPVNEGSLLVAELVRRTKLKTRCDAWRERRARAEGCNIRWRN